VSRPADRPRPWYRNAGRGDDGRRVNLLKGRPKFHEARADWVRSGLATCGADIRRAGFVTTTPTQERACARCWAAAQAVLS